MSANVSEIVKRNDDLESGHGPHQKIPRLEAVSSGNASTQPQNAIPLEGQSTLESSGWSLNLPSVIAAQTSLESGTSLDGMSPLTDDIQSETSHQAASLNSNARVQRTPLEPYEILQNYLYDSESFQNLRTYITNALITLYGKKRHNFEDMGALEDLIRMLRCEDHNFIYRLLGMAILGPLENAEALEDDLGNLNYEETTDEENNVTNEPPTTVTPVTHSVGSDEAIDKIQISTEERSMQDVAMDTHAISQVHISPTEPPDTHQRIAEPSSSSSQVVPQTSSIPGSANRNPTRQFDMDSLYKTLEPVIHEAERKMSYKRISWRKIITTFGKPAFLAIFEPEEIINGCASGRIVKGGRMERFNDDKVCVVARFLGFLLSNPDNFSIAALKTYVSGLSKKKRGGLRSRKYDYFEESILHKFASDERRKLRRAAQRRSQHEFESE